MCKHVGGASASFNCSLLHFGKKRSMLFFQDKGAVVVIYILRNILHNVWIQWQNCCHNRIRFRSVARAGAIRRLTYAMNMESRRDVDSVCFRVSGHANDSIHIRKPKTSDFKIDHKRIYYVCCLCVVHYNMSIHGLNGVTHTHTLTHRHKHSHTYSMHIISVRYWWKCAFYIIMIQ